MGLARPVVFGNWKMHGLRADSLALAGSLVERAVRPTGTLGVFPPATVLRDVARRLEGSRILAGAQDCHPEASGAFTGSISASMVKDAGGTAVLVGHSERRHGLGEDDAVIRRKVLAAQGEGLLVVLCVGETEAEWQAGEREARLRRQIHEGLAETVDAALLVLAYEPVWAIGTGRTPSLEDIAGTHAFLRRELVGRLPAAQDVPLLYGGSVKPGNAADIMALPDVDGALVGGASLDAAGFWSIYQAGGGA
ncbi:triose-phosphate isomerase [Marinimicrococcus flavescens]|uniref:Triosephosphate isomerase n=1 Tax=Marinimicrococcus flavescens TaxID=3031815 RepID=A0AAP3XSH2_9PROT|nr:triose-phosphate isomerase [Marinimicrococcus flavescens]